MCLRLECDEECATLERNRRLAEALQIDPSSDPFNVRSTAIYSDSLKEDARSVFATYMILENWSYFLCSLSSQPTNADDPDDSD